VDEQFQDLFKIKPNRKNVAVGDILIAEPFLEGRYFSRAVVYIVEHDEKGSIGFVLNKPISYTTSDLVTELKGMDFPVYLGGPVEQNQLYYLHTHSELPDALHIDDGIYWGGDFVHLTRLIREGKVLPEEIRFFAGYSGWEAGQLQKELEENSWMVGNMERTRLLQLPWSELWEKSMSDLGGRYKIWANFPEDPIMN
jgi:putative transcriptional regulator